MTYFTISNFIGKYLPGFWLIAALLFIHVVLSTVYHIKKKDFSFDLWPNYMINFVLYMVFIVFANAVMDLAINQIHNSIVQTIFIGIQAMVYIQAIAYYINNIIEHLSKLGLPINKDFKEVLNGVVGRVKSLITGQ